jgi:hypothetical protein
VTNVVGEEIEVTFRDSFKVLLLNHDSSLSYFQINASEKSDIFKIDLIIKPKSNNPYVIPTFNSILFSKEQLNNLSNIVKMNEVTLGKSLNVFYKYPPKLSLESQLHQFNINQEGSSGVQIIFTNDFTEETVGIVINEIKVILERLGLDDSDYYFDNKELIKQNSLESPEKFKARLNEFDLARNDLRPEFNQYFNDKQFINRKEKYSGTFEIEFGPASIVNFNFLGSNRQELTDFKSYTIDFMMKVLDFLPSSNLHLNSFLLVDGEVKTETLQSDRKILEHIVLGGLIGLFFSMIIIYGNVLRKDVRQELKKSKSR